MRHQVVSINRTGEGQIYRIDDAPLHQSDPRVRREVMRQCADGPTVIHRGWRYRLPADIEHRRGSVLAVCIGAAR